MPILRTSRLLFVSILLTVGACGSGSPSDAPDVDLPPISEDEFVTLIETAESPMVVNLWASWCIPCRSEAPLLVEAHRSLGDEVRFIGIATSDTEADAAAFAEEFGLEFENYFDPDAEIRSWIGSTGLPTTFFVSADGEVTSTLFGMIDERRLALEIDELLRR